MSSVSMGLCSMLAQGNCVPPHFPCENNALVRTRGVVSRTMEFGGSFFWLSVKIKFFKMLITVLPLCAPPSIKFVTLMHVHRQGCLCLNDALLCCLCLFTVCANGALVRTTGGVVAVIFSASTAVLARGSVHKHSSVGRTVARKQATPGGWGRDLKAQPRPRPKNCHGRGRTATGTNTRIFSVTQNNPAAEHVAIGACAHRSKTQVEHIIYSFSPFGA